MIRWLVMTLVFLLAPNAMKALPCTFSPTSMNLGNYTGVLSQTGAATMSVTCPNSLAYNIGFNAGTAVGATVTTRKLSNLLVATLSYGLYRDSARLLNWGNISGTDTLAGTGTGSAQTITVYPQLPAGNYVTPGTYTDTVTISIYSSAATVTATFTITATVVASCAIAVNALNFGNYSGVLIAATSTATVTCTTTTAFNIGLNAGTASGATVTTRKMTSPASNTLNYSLFRDVTQLLNWGTTPLIDTVASVGLGNAQQFTIYGQLPAGQSANPAVYTDTIIATVTY